MSCEDCSEETLDAAETALTSALSGPRKATSDGLTVEGHSLADLIAADKHIAAKCAARSRNRGLRFSKLVPPGTV